MEKKKNLGLAAHPAQTWPRGGPALFLLPCITICCCVLFVVHHRLEYSN